MDSIERENIINETIERVFKMLPDVLGNLMKSHAVYAKTNRKFYADNPEFATHKDIVLQAISKIEEKNPLRSYDEILKEATPIIKEQLKLVKPLSLMTPNKEGLNLEFPLSDNGAL